MRAQNRNWTPQINRVSTDNVRGGPVDRTTTAPSVRNCSFKDIRRRPIPMVAISGLVGAGHGRRARSIGPVRWSGIEVGLARQATHGADQHATEPRVVTPPSRGPAHSPSGLAAFASISRCSTEGIVWLALRCCRGPAHSPSWPTGAGPGGLGGAFQEWRAIRRKLPCQSQAALRPRSSSWSAQTEYSRLLTEQSHARAPGFKAWQQWLQVLLDRSKQDRVHRCRNNRGRCDSAQRPSSSMECPDWPTSAALAGAGPPRPESHKPHHRVAGPLVSEISIECHPFSEADD